MRAQIGEAADRRHTAPIASVTLWAVLCGVAAIVLQAVTADFGTRLGSYRTGIITLIVFLFAAAYFVRRHALWFSLRWSRLAMRFPRPVALRLILLDRLETWRTLHITTGMFVLLPFWWHLRGGPASVLETVLKVFVLALVASGLVAVVIEEYLPIEMRRLSNQKVLLSDVEEALHSLYVEAEEKILGHSEQLVRAYLREIRPLLVGHQPAFRMMRATIGGGDPAAGVCAPARTHALDLGAERAAYAELVEIAERKIRLEHNQFNLQLNSTWLRLHSGLVISTIVLITFHVLGVLYFAGL